MPTFAGIRTRLWAAWGRKPAKVYYANGGIGDELMLTAVARAARIANQPIDVVARYPEIWTGNTDALSVGVEVDRWWHAQQRGWIGTEIVHLAYRTGSPGHIAQQMADHLGLTLAPEWRPVLPVPDGPRDRRLIVFQNSCRGARYAATTKEWPHARWNELAARLAPEFRLVQIGTTADPAVPGTEDRRGRTALLDAARLIAGAGLFLGLESGLQHVAAAVRTPAVIIYGGRSRPRETGYPFNRNLTREPACVGCGLNDGCPHQLVCLDIPVAEVEAAVRATLAA